MPAEMKPLLSLLALCAFVSTTLADTLAVYDFNTTAGTDARTAYTSFTRGSYVNLSNIRIPSDPANLSYLVRTDLDYENQWDGNVMNGRVRSFQSNYVTDDTAAITRDAWFASP